VTVKTDLALALSVKEEASGDLGNTRGVFNFNLAKFFASGTGSNQFDVVYSDTHEAAASAKTYDLLGSLTSVLTGSAISFVTLNGIFIKNKSTTSTEVLSIGGGSNPVSGLWGAGGDLIKVGPGGLFAWFDPVDGITPVAGTGDILQIDPGSDTIEFDILLLGRSA